VITIDFETRSRCDLKKSGTSKYARHPSTEVLCLAYSIHGSPTELWTPEDPRPDVLLSRIESGYFVEAHNAAFERQIWYWICHKRLGWPDVRFDQWRCSLAVCSRLALPRSLAEAGKAIGVSIQKDEKGAKIMLRLCKPKKPSQKDPGDWDNTPMKFLQLYDYCKNDVNSEKELSLKVGSLPPKELKLWQLDQRINMRGLYVDLPAVEKAINIVNTLKATFDAKIQNLTEGKVKTPKQLSAMQLWIKERQGEAIPDLSAETVSTWLMREDLDPGVRDMLKIRADASGSATAKLQAIVDRCDDDRRVRWNLVYHGAATGRWAGSGIQIQNFPRGFLNASQIDLAHQLIEKNQIQGIDMLLGDPIDVVKSCLRSFVRAPEGSRLLVCDFASIEARVLAWLAGEEDLIKVFATGGDPYKVMAGKIYDCPADEVTKAQRQIGKIAILGLGYGMGHKAFRNACRIMAGVNIDSAFAKKVVKAYREANPNIKQFWSAMNNACIQSISTKQPHRVGRLGVSCDGSWMKIALPSERRLHYRDPALIQVRAPWSEGFTGTISGDETLAGELEDQDIDLGERKDGAWEYCDIPKSAIPWMKVQTKFRFAVAPKKPEFIKQIQHMGVNSATRSWSKTRTYGGKLVENVTQAVARDFLADAMLRVEEAGYPIVATVHDEILSELKYGIGSLEEFEHLMREVPAWGSGCPIEVEGYEAERYRK
jgi:DNA polymerase